jgi:enamine deaminase RidA (YjgF/YER057c/UK114 family)
LERRALERRVIRSGSPYEERLGYSRAVVSGGHVYVSGTIANMPEGEEPPADAYGQAMRIFEIIGAALEEAGAALGDVVRTRWFLTRGEDLEEVGRAHREIFGEARPASTAVVVQLLDPRWLVEIEADAVLPG